MLLCFSASSISREAPLWFSYTNSSNFFAFPWPKASVEMECSANIWRMAFSHASVVLLMSSSLAGLAPLMSNRLFSVAFAWGHHSNLATLSICLSETWKAFFSFSSLSVKCFSWPGRLASSSRPTSSLRRSAMAAFAPNSLKSGLKSIFSRGVSLSGPLTVATNWCCMACCALSRSPSLRSSSFRRMSPHSFELLGGITTFLLFTSSSPLNGNRPVTKPYMTTPMAQTSTFRP
mmetsp:Transcript_93248/g.263626  ORF Transcript_93248/g.263626 Transcript_93248/m.263626 type:complete len:233 (-) Transcript_93248:710-1408(-)